MTYSYTQVSQYLTCPRVIASLSGWLAGKRHPRCHALRPLLRTGCGGLFRHEDPAAALFEQWAPCKDLGLTHSGNDTWDRMLQQGIQLLERFIQDGRVQVRKPSSHQQIRFSRTLRSGNSFVAFVDAVGELDSTPCVLEWKTSSARYPEEPAGIAALDPQLVCYSWMSGIQEVAQVVFVRKRTVEVQYLRATITDDQRQEYETLVEDTVQRIESGCSCRTAAFVSLRTRVPLSLPRALPRPARSGGGRAYPQAGS
jgi:hypothetical protein